MLVVHVDGLESIQRVKHIKDSFVTSFVYEKVSFCSVDFIE